MSIKIKEPITVIDDLKGKSLNQYETIAVKYVSAILPQLIDCITEDSTDSDRFMIVNGCKVKRYSKRHDVYKTTQECVGCQLRGVYLLAQRTRGETCNYHWNMYGKNSTGDFVILGKYKQVDNTYKLLCQECKDKLKQELDAE